MATTYRVEVGMVFDVEAETEHDAEQKLLEGFRSGKFTPSADEIAVRALGEADE